MYPATTRRIGRVRTNFTTSTPAENGTHYAFALHYELTAQKVSLKSTIDDLCHESSKDGEGDDDELISMAAHGLPIW